MIPATACAMALLGAGNLSLGQPSTQESRSAAHHEQPSLGYRPEHHMSAGLSMELMQTLPPPNQGRFRTNPGGRLGAYQMPTTVGLSPFYPTVTPYNSYAYPYGLGGYYPPGAGGHFTWRGGWWYW